jgi:2-oxoglutarate ferredoxin oxidoreductase subunit alpha
MEAPAKSKPATRSVEKLERVVIRFAGDSGDGMQLTGSQFTATTAAVGNDLATLPDYPAEIRAPVGTLAGVSGYQINFSSEDIFTPGDAPDVLVAMNPAALKTNLPDLRPNGLLIINTDAFRKTDLKKAGYEVSPLEDGTLDGYRSIPVELTRLTRTALLETGLPTRAVDRCKNFFALGMMYYLYNRSLEVSMNWIEEKFSDKPDIVQANQLALKAGYAFCEATEVFQTTYEVPPARLKPGTYRNVNGNQALALGFVAASMKSGLPLFQGSYPITPASEILHELSGYKNYGVVTFQAEDEISAIGATIGAAFAGNLGITTTSGPGLSLKQEFLGLAVMVELPIVVVDIQRGGPSTGLPTKTEQADLLQAMFGRHSESPCIVLAACSPADCFDAAFEASRLALTHMTPVVLLADGFLANGTEPWRLPDLDALEHIEVRFRTDPENFEPYARDPKTLVRPWAVPGSVGLEHRVGGLEKAEGSGDVSYDSVNHERMIHIRERKVVAVADDIPLAEPTGDSQGKLLVLGWGSTFGAINGAVRHARADGLDVSMVHLRHLNPFPRNLEELLNRFERILVPENNTGQLAFLIQGSFLREVTRLNKVQGQPFKESEILDAITEIVQR